MISYKIKVIILLQLFLIILLPTARADSDKYTIKGDTLFVEEGVVELKEGDIDLSDTYSCVKLPSSLKIIGDRAFANKTNISDVILPNGLERIGKEAFLGCELIEELIIPDSVYNLGTFSTFMDCKKLRRLQLPASITRIPIEMCKGCVNLKSIIIPKNVREIGSNAFLNCTSLRKVEFPESFINISESAFDNCPRLSKKNIEERLSTNENSSASRFSLDSRLEVAKTLSSPNFLRTPIHGITFGFSEQIDFIQLLPNKRDLIIQSGIEFSLLRSTHKKSIENVSVDFSDRFRSFNIPLNIGVPVITKTRVPMYVLPYLGINSCFKIVAKSYSEMYDTVNYFDMNARRFQLKANVGLDFMSFLYVGYRLGFDCMDFVPYSKNKTLYHNIFLFVPLGWGDYIRGMK